MCLISRTFRGLPSGGKRLRGFEKVIEGFVKTGVAPDHCPFKVLLIPPGKNSHCFAFAIYEEKVFYAEVLTFHQNVFYILDGKILYQLIPAEEP